MAREFVLGIDIGTTSVKACVFNLKGNSISESEELISSYYPQPGWVEQNPDDIERAAVQAVRVTVEKAGIENNEIITLGFSSAMHSLICINEDGMPLSPAIIWADGRSNPQAEKIMETHGHRIYSKTGTPIHPMSPFLKLLWMKETQYEPYKKAKYFMSIKEYLLERWFGQRVVDYSMASATGLFNPHTHQWDNELLELTGIDSDQLSKLVPPTEILRGIKRNIAEEMGINPEIPFVVGAADGQLANLGIGAILPGEVAVSVGTSGAIRQLTKGTKISENHETFCYSFTEETTIIGGPTNNGGIVLQWLKELMNYQGSYNEFLSEAEHVAPGAEGIIFLPYINGERAPLWNQHAKGNFYGVSITHKKEHFIRAVLEGITFNLFQIGKALERLAGEPQKIFVNGGLSRSTIWLQMMADIFETEIFVSETHNSAAWGAAWTALVAIGKANSFEEIKRNIPMGNAFIPNNENSAVYKNIYEKYEMLAKDIAKHF
ncbi:gluconokinase [Neobacillus ginsengisoli]|uniref:Gluconokinase n=1 Tax=Neobacillus ginsengisoli TaxID=904295 RepID=A0ABT9XR45_9BACI|nr:gluconokinase [Neobacillus ginsengisoli]MDQ0198025.1 gluconokinase [Neobacillus ginsengisoli]